MKYCITFMLLAFSFMSFNVENTMNEILLEEAINKQMVTLSVKGLGGHSGLTLKSTLRNKSLKTITVVIPAGMVMAPTDSTMQDLLLVKTERVVLKKGEVKDVNLHGYCCNAYERSPSAGMVFSVGSNRSKKLKELAEFINKNEFSEDAIQSAVWSVSDGKSVSEIFSDDQATVEPLRTEVSRITGQNDDWYAVQAIRTVDEMGYIQSSPVLVKGEIRVTLSKAEKIKQEVCKENGEVVWSPKGFLEMPKPGPFVYSFKLKVSGWDKGKYFVKVSVPGQVILKQEFSI